MKYLICNLKGNKTYQEINDYLNTLNINSSNIIMAPSNIYLNLFSNIKASLAAQDIPEYEANAITGDTTINQLKSLNVSYIFLGHYERRKFYHENDYTIIKKAQNIFNNDLKVILFVGETKEELMRHVEFQKIGKTLIKFLNNIKTSDLKNLIIAYEPTYMIGENIPVDLNHIFKMTSFIKELCKNYYHINIDVVYGGNVNNTNIDNLLTIPNLDGLVLGKSSLDANFINKISKKMTLE